MGDVWEVCCNPLVPCGAVSRRAVVDRGGLRPEAMRGVEGHDVCEVA